MTVKIFISFINKLLIMLQSMLKEKMYGSISIIETMSYPYL